MPLRDPSSKMPPCTADTPSMVRTTQTGLTRGGCTGAAGRLGSAITNSQDPRGRAALGFPFSRDVTSYKRLEVKPSNMIPKRRENRNKIL